MKTLLSLVLALGFSGNAFAQADTVATLTLVGDWFGTGNSAVFGTGKHHPAPKGKEREVRFTHPDMTFKVDRQEGRNFSGTVSSKNHKERFLGALAADLKSGVMVDEDGYYNFKVSDANTLEISYTQASLQPLSAPSVASCYELHRK